MDNKFIEILPSELNKNTFDLIKKTWMLVTAGDKQGVNTMTASWGGFGIMWHKNVTYIVVRPQRHTKKFLDSHDTFSLTFFSESFRKTLNYLGTVSGKDENKIAKSNLTLSFKDDTPFFEEADLTIICTKLFAQDFTEDSFIDKSLLPKLYPENDLHTLYISEIKNIMVKI